MNNQKIINYVKNKKLNEYKFGNITLIIKDPLTTDINLPDIFDRVNSILPDHFLRLIDIIYIGNFDFLNQRQVNAMYMDGAIYLSNVQDDIQDIEDDIIHEFAHAVEEKFGYEIYEDDKVKNEFLLKRRKLKFLLEDQDHDVEHLDFFNTEYNKEFDDFLNEVIGYDILRILTVDLFLAPYSTTSLREYFGRGFEEFYLGKRQYLREICPYINKKLYLLNKLEDGAINYEF